MQICQYTCDNTQYAVCVMQLDLSACLWILVTYYLLLIVSQDSSIGGHSVAEMERVVAAMRKVVERLQGENESLRRSAKQRGSSVTHLETENRRLKACWRSSENCVFFPLCSLIVASSPGSLLHRGSLGTRL